MTSVTAACHMMAQRQANVHPTNVAVSRTFSTHRTPPGRPWPTLRSTIDDVLDVLVIAGIAAVAVIAIVAAGRRPSEGDRRTVTAIDDMGLHLEPAPDVEGASDTGPPSVGPVEWASIFEIAVMTRRELGGTWFGFEVRSETAGLLLVDGKAGPGEAFLAESHRFRGFDHATLAEALGRRRGRAVCYRR